MTDFLRWRIGEVTVTRVVELTSTTIGGHIFPQAPAHLVATDHQVSADVDAALAARTRRAFLERYADRPVLVIGTHFAGPTAGRVVRDGDAFRLDC